ncbi:serine/threonine-protein kinase [Streptomyces sp. NPDC006798]|uniref:serine/threonine-protein kinase n=1 Tax=Streptomyces sp. NPDC006798 TaxID=3155462 RepID=UPI0033C4D905
MHGDRLVADRYRLDGALGEGGMGVVWRARDEVLGREVAVKEVRAPAGLSDDQVRRLYARLEREARAAGRITHRNVVTVYDVVFDHGGAGGGPDGSGAGQRRPWIVMELIRGLSLADVLAAEGPLAPERAARIGAEVLAALTAAHDAGVLHRDVKPGNVLVGNDGRIVLSDFGIASLEGTDQLTMTGELIGSPEFLAPERALGRTPGPASDLWSLGVLLYAAVEGVPPFRQHTPLNTLRAVVEDELPPPRRAGELTPVIAGLLRKDPAERPSAADTARRLRLAASGGTPPPGPYSPTVTSAGPVPGSGSGSGSGPGYGSGAGPAPGSEGATTPSPVPPPDPRTGPKRPAVTLAAGAAVLVIAAAGLAWTLVDGARDGGGPSGTPAPGVSRSAQAGTAPGTAGTADRPADDRASGAPKDRGSPPPRARQTVTVRIEAVRDRYTGDCPPGAEAPLFRARIEVGRTPAEVTYRWTTERGAAGSDRRTLSFGAGYGRARTVEYTVAAFRDGEVLRDRIGLEIAGPVETRSERLAFSVECDPAPSASSGSPPAAAEGTTGTP